MLSTAVSSTIEWRYMSVIATGCAQVVGCHIGNWRKGLLPRQIIAECIQLELLKMRLRERYVDGINIDVLNCFLKDRD